MNTFLSQLLIGVSNGGIYASVALALVMIYQSTRDVNFAQGEMAMFSTYIAWALIQAGFPYWVAFALTVVGSFVVGMALEVTVIRPMYKAPVLSVVVVYIGLLVIFHSLAGWLFGFDVLQFPSPFPDHAWYGTYISPHQVGAIVVTLVVVTLVFGFFRYTPLGLSMRAAAQNPLSARMVGIPVNRMLMLGWGLAGALGAVAGMMAAPVVYLDPSMMSNVLLYAFAGVLVGGINNPLGAVVGGFIVGIMETLVGGYIAGPNLKLSVAVVIIIGTLIVKPSGLLGKPVVVRV